MIVSTQHGPMAFRFCSCSTALSSCWQPFSLMPRQLCEGIPHRVSRPAENGCLERSFLPSLFFKYSVVEQCWSFKQSPHLLEGLPGSNVGCKALGEFGPPSNTGHKMLGDSSLSSNLSFEGSDQGAAKVRTQVQR